MSISLFALAPLNPKAMATAVLHIQVMFALQLRNTQGPSHLRASSKLACFYLKENLFLCSGKVVHYKHATRKWPGERAVRTLHSGYTK